MKLVRAVLVAALAAPISLAVSLGSGCSHDAAPPVQPVVQPDDRPPLPPDSGTPIGYLVDDAGELKLSDAQLAKLKEINDDLAAKLSADDADMRPEPVQQQPTQQSDKGRGFSMRGGGGVSGMGSGMNAMQPGHTLGGNTDPNDPTGTAGPDGPRSYIIPAAVVTKVYRARAQHVHAAVEKALALLDRTQQATARKVLVDHGVNLDTGEVHQSGDPGTQKLEEGKPGQPLPRESDTGN